MPPFSRELDHITLSPLTSDMESAMVGMIRRNLASFEEAGSVLASSFRRLENFFENYNQAGCLYLMLRDQEQNSLVGGAGIGPLAGLPPEEGIGEIRELVIEPSRRGQGLGAYLLHGSLQEAKKLGYRQIYLETTPQMVHAQRLFKRFGFRPVVQKNRKGEPVIPQDQLPFYFMLENLDEALQL